MKFMLTFQTYAIASFGALLGLILFAIMTHEGLYSILLFLSKARISTAVTYNFLIMLGFWFVRQSIWIFLGRLRELEIEQVCDAGSGFLMDTIMFLVLTSPTINGAEASTLSLFQNVGFVVIMKAFHLISQTRVVHVFESGIPRLSALAGLLALMVILLIQDIFLIRIFFNALKGNSSLHLWILFEFLGMLVIASTSIGKFCLNYIDLQMENGWPGKSAALFFLDVIGDVLSLLAVLVFMCLFVLKYPSQLPIHMTANIIQVVRTLASKVRSFQRCRVLVKEMAKRFPEATFEELEEADTCIICRDLLYEGSLRLPCGHILHIECLKAWFVQQQTCPTCRSDVMTISRTTPPVTATTEPIQDVPQQRQGTQEVDNLSHDRLGGTGSSVNEDSVKGKMGDTVTPSNSDESKGTRVPPKVNDITDERQGNQENIWKRFINYLIPSIVAPDSAVEDMRWKANDTISRTLTSRSGKATKRKNRKARQEDSDRFPRSKMHKKKEITFHHKRQNNQRVGILEPLANLISEEIRIATHMSEFFRQQSLLWLTHANKSGNPTGEISTTVHPDVDQPSLFLSTCQSSSSSSSINQMTQSSTSYSPPGVSAPGIETPSPFVFPMTEHYLTNLHTTPVASTLSQPGVPIPTDQSNLNSNDLPPLLTPSQLTQLLSRR